MAENKTHTAAVAWLMKHRDLSRNEAVAHCTAHLVESLEVSQDTANLVSLQAMADLECASQTAWIDVEASTAHVVVIRRPGGRKLACTVKDLLRVHALGAPSDTNVH